MAKKRLVLIDGHAVLFRAFHAMPGFATPDGRPSGAVYGFTNVLVRVLRELEPTWVITCFDTVGPTFRDAMYADYKATRSETPKDLIAQEPMVHQVLESFGVPIFALSGFEANDLIATLVSQALGNDQGPMTKAQEHVDEVVVVTGDRDLLQLSQPRVSIYLLRAGVKDINLLDEAAVTELIGLPPTQLLEWKALRGDPSDNIVGVPGVGDKTALTLISQYGTLEKLYEAVENAAVVTNISDRIRGLLLEHKERAFKNRELLTVAYDAPIKLDLDKSTGQSYRRDATAELLASFGFKNLLTRLPASADMAQQQNLF